MQQLTTCNNCGQQVYIDTSSQVALACPTCNSVLTSAAISQQTKEVSSTGPNLPNPYAENASAFSELTPLTDSSPVPPEKSFRTMDTVSDINENANKKLLVGLLGGVFAITLLLVFSLYFLLSNHKTEESVVDVAQNEHTDQSVSESQDSNPKAPQLEFDTLPSLSQQISANREMRYEWHPTKRKSYKYSFKMSAGLEEVKITGTNKLNLSPAPASSVFDVDDLNSPGTGTCFFVHPDGLAVTCAHVVEGSQTVEVKYNGSWLPAAVVAFDAKNDLALLRINKKRVPVLPIKKSNDLRLAQKIHIIGYPIQDMLGSSVKFNSGAISGINTQDGASEIQFDATINPGNSGGPVIDQAGNVIGVASAMFQGDGFSSVGLGVQSDMVLKLLQNKEIELPLSNQTVDIKNNAELAEQTTPSVCLVKASGRKGVKVLDYESEINMSAGSSPVSRRKLNGKLLVDESGEVIDSTGGGSLSILLVSPATIGIEKVDLYGGDKWQHRDISIILKPGERKSGSPFEGLTPKRRFGLPQLTPEMRSTAAAVIGFVTTNFEKRNAPEPGTVFYVVRRKIDSLAQDRSSPGFLDGYLQGSMTFDIKKKCISKVRMTGKILTVVDGRLRHYMIDYQVDLDEPGGADGRFTSNPSKPTSSVVSKKKKFTPVRPKLTKNKAQKVDPKKEELHEDILARFDDISWGVKGMDIARQGENVFVAVGKSSGVAVYDWTNRRMTDALEKVTSAATGKVVAASPDGKKFLFGVRQGTIQVYDLSEEGKANKIDDFDDHGSEIRFIKIASDNDTVISGDAAKELRIWSLDKRGKTKLIVGFERGLRDAVLYDENKKAYVFDGRAVYDVDLVKGVIIGSTKLQYSNDEGCFSPDGKLFAHRQMTDKMIIFSTEEMKSVAKFECRFFPRFLTFSPDSKQLYWGTHGWAHYFDLEKKEQTKFKIHKTFGLEKILFSPDGKECAIATGASAGEIVILKRPAS